MISHLCFRAFNVSLMLIPRDPTMFMQEKTNQLVNTNIFICFPLKLSKINNLKLFIRLFVLLFIRKLLTPDGHVVIVDILDYKFYAVGDKIFRAFCTTVDGLQEAFKSCGFEI